MRNAIRSAGLQFLYARYAKSKGWNDHPMAVRQRVEMYLDLGTGPVTEAIAHYEACRRRWAVRLSHGTVAAVILALTVYAASHAAPAAAEVSKTPTTRSAKPTGESDANSKKRENAPLRTRT